MPRVRTGRPHRNRAREPARYRAHRRLWCTATTIRTTQKALKLSGCACCCYARASAVHLSSLAETVPCMGICTSWGARGEIATRQTRIYSHGPTRVVTASLTVAGRSFIIPHSLVRNFLPLVRPPRLLARSFLSLDRRVWLYRCKRGCPRITQFVTGVSLRHRRVDASYAVCRADTTYPASAICSGVSCRPLARSRLRPRRAPWRGPLHSSPILPRFRA